MFRVSLGRERLCWLNMTTIKAIFRNIAFRVIAGQFALVLAVLVMSRGSSINSGSGSGSGIGVTVVSSLPGTCTAGSLYLLTTTEKLWYCKVANTLQLLVDSDGGPFELSGDTETAPSNPASNTGKIWFDSSSGTFKAKINNGSVVSSTTIIGNACGGGQAVTGISTAGVVTCAAVGGGTAPWINIPWGTCTNTGTIRQNGLGWASGFIGRECNSTNMVDRAMRYVAASSTAVLYFQAAFQTATGTLRIQYEGQTTTATTDIACTTGIDIRFDNPTYGTQTVTVLPDASTAVWSSDISVAVPSACRDGSPLWVRMSLANAHASREFDVQAVGYKQ